MLDCHLRMFVSLAASSHFLKNDFLLIPLSGIEVSKRAGKWAEESLYEIEGDTVDGRRGPFKSRQRMINKVIMSFPRIRP